MLSHRLGNIRSRPPSEAARDLLKHMRRGPAQFFGSADLRCWHCIHRFAKLSKQIDSFALEDIRTQCLKLYALQTQKAALAFTCRSKKMG
jgi:hypothetical protein